MCLYLSEVVGPLVSLFLLPSELCWHVIITMKRNIPPVLMGPLLVTHSLSLSPSMSLSLSRRATLIHVMGFLVFSLHICLSLLHRVRVLGELSQEWCLSLCCFGPFFPLPSGESSRSGPHALIETGDPRLAFSSGISFLFTFVRRLRPALSFSKETAL